MTELTTVKQVMNVIDETITDMTVYTKAFDSKALSPIGFDAKMIKLAVDQLQTNLESEVTTKEIITAVQGIFKAIEKNT